MLFYYQTVTGQETSRVERTANTDTLRTATAILGTFRGPTARRFVAVAFDEITRCLNLVYTVQRVALVEAARL